MRPVNQHLIEKMRLQGRSMVDGDGRVSVEVPCRGCGYNLRGSPADGGCPECGHAVEHALRDDRPEFSDPRWLRRVVLGGKLGVIAGAAAAVNAAFFILGALVAELSSSTNVIFLLEHYLLLALLAALALTWVLAVIACWLTTSPDPTRFGIRRETIYRWTMRGGLSTCVPAMMLTLWLTPAFNSFAGLGDRVVLFFLFTTPIGLLSAGLIALLQYLKRLSQRMGNWAIVRAYNTVSFGLAATTLIYIAVNGLFTILSPRGANLLPAVFCGCDMLIAAGFILWAIFLADQTRRALNDAYRRQVR